MIINGQQLSRMTEAMSVPDLKEQIWAHINKICSIDPGFKPEYFAIFEELAAPVKSLGFPKATQYFNFVTIAFLFGRRFFETIPAMRTLLSATDMSADEKIEWLFMLSRDCLARIPEDELVIVPAFGGTLAANLAGMEERERSDMLYFLGLPRQLASQSTFIF